MNVDKLIDILETQSASYNQFRIFAKIIREVKLIQGCSFYVNNGNIYITKGNSNTYPCIVAHMDTVHEIVEDLTAIQFGRNITGINRFTMKQSGIGGDDKVGVFIALECLQFFDNIKVAFFRDEETGCEGSFRANLAFFANCNFILQCDRNGYQDFIVEAEGVALSSKKFQSTLVRLLHSYNYSFAKGLMTDVMALKELGVSCSVANISCGYFKPHTDHEFVNIDCVENCIHLVKAIIGKYGSVYFPHFYEVPVYWRQKLFYPQFSSGALCIDCWSPDPTSTGYCQACNEYYQLLTC